ncbi:hypothetical protein V1514DRAFT_335409 [Lipomyces japonicus]|uniref:uncharacterized protein n=1 Tax=Lipomyces japonicus TaxID=56871 RepID=UPI0034CEE328
MSDAASIITRGAVAEICKGNELSAWDPNQPLVLQLLTIREFNAADASKRIRVILSDIDNFINCIIGSSYADVINATPKGGLIRITKYHTVIHPDSKKPIIFATALETLPEFGPTEKIGNPQIISWTPTGAYTSTAATPASAGGSTFYGNQGPVSRPQYQPSEFNASSASDAKRENLFTIETLSPFQNKWTIKARVSFKSEVKHWHNQRGEGKLFSVNFLDQTGEIKATGFNEAVDKFYDRLVEGEVYYLTKAKVTMARKKFSNLPIDYEITLERDTEIERCTDGAAGAAIPQQKFDFVESLEKISDINKDSMVDVIGVIKEVRACQQFTGKTSGRPFDKRDVIIVDTSQYAIPVTVWGKQAIDFSVPEDTVVAFKGVKVGDFNGKNLSMLSASTLTVNPDVPEAHRLRGWYDQEGKTGSFNTMQSISGAAGAGGSLAGRPENLKTIAQVSEQQLGLSDQPDYYSVKGTIMHYRNENFAYPACPTEGCNKKLVADGMTWRCEKCDKSFDTPVYRYVLMFAIHDHTGQMWLSSFDDVGNVVLGNTADYYMTLNTENKEKLVEEFSKRSAYSYTFRVRARQDTYQNATRVRNSALAATPLNYAQESSQLIKLIKGQTA